MNAVAAPVNVSVRERSAKLVWSADGAAIGVVLALVGVLAALTWRKWGGIDTDAGYDLVAGTRIAHGQLPYVDFIYYYGPLAPFAAALVAWVGGSTLGAFYAFGLIVGTAIVLTTYAVARQFVGAGGAALAAALTATVGFGATDFGYVLPYTYADSLGILAVLAFLLAAIRCLRSGGTAAALAAGAAAGAAALTKPEFLLSVAVAALVVGLVAIRTGRLGRRAAIGFLAPAVVIPAAVYGSFLTTISLHQLLWENLYPRAEIHAAAGVTLDNRAPLTLSSLVAAAGKLVLYVAGIGVLLISARLIARGGRARNATIAAALIGLVGAIGLALVDPEALRHGLKFAYGWIPAGAAVATVVLARRALRGDSTQLPELAVSAALAALAATAYAVFDLYALYPQMAVWSMPLVAVFLVRLHLVELARSEPARVLGAAWLCFLVGAGVLLTAKDARLKSDFVRGPGGAIAAPHGQAAPYQAAVRLIDARTTPHQQILIAPVDTTLYVLAKRQSPLDRISLLPGALPTAAAQRAVINRLERARVPLVITNRRQFVEYGHTNFGGSFDQVLAAWLRRSYRHTETLRGSGSKAVVLDIWSRRYS